MSQKVQIIIATKITIFIFSRNFRKDVVKYVMKCSRVLVRRAIDSPDRNIFPMRVVDFNEQRLNNIWIAVITI